MAEMSLNQIADKINETFNKSRLVFWYDDDSEFRDDVGNLEINGKIHYLTRSNSFKTKILLEREDKESCYLIYADFSLPKIKENHLADIIKYSDSFYADRVALLLADLKIGDKYRKVLEEHRTFFTSQKRTNKFASYNIESHNSRTIILSMLATLVNSKSVNFEEIIKKLISSEDLSDSKFLEEFKKHNLFDDFWELVSKEYGYHDESPSLKKLLISFFVSYAYKITGYCPIDLEKYLLSKEGSAMTFIDQLLDSSAFRERFDSISKGIYQAINGDEIYDALSINDYINLNIFEETDKRIISWIRDRILDETLNIYVNDKSIIEICWDREKRHFGSDYKNEYHMLRHAYNLVSFSDYKPEKTSSKIVKKYIEEDYKIDFYYRKYYYYLDRVKNKSLFDKLTNLVENIYLDKYLSKLTISFSRDFNYYDLHKDYKLQKDFYNNFVNDSESVIVIISDAFRYELAKELVDDLEKDKDISKIDIDAMIGIIPSKTNLGMAALLPNSNLEYDYYNDKVFVDGKELKSSTISREEILKSKNIKSRAFQYSDIDNMTRDELRDNFRGVKIAYIYHDQIDARGDQLKSEDETFDACADALEEIRSLIRRLTGNVSRTNFIVTADHGFIYKRTGLEEYQKIKINSSKENWDVVRRRYAITSSDKETMGVRTIKKNEIIGGYIDRDLKVPESYNVFQAYSDGTKFYHGGIAPQEIIIPAVTIKSAREKIDTKNVELMLISTLSTITKMNFNLEFMQTEPISDVVTPAEYKILLVDEKNNPVSNEQRHYADNKSKESIDRFSKFKFTLKNKEYYPEDKYYLLVIDTETGIELISKELVIDIPL